MFDSTNLTNISDEDQDTRMFGLREKSLKYRCNFLNTHKPGHKKTRRNKDKDPTVLSCQPRVTVASCFVYKFARVL